MTEREKFEEKFPVPSETVWSDHLSAYVQKNRRVLSAYDDLWQVWQAARATPALPQGEHDLEDVRCQCCGYMTYHREHMGCIRSAYKQALPQVPEGMAIAPVEPTARMLQAAFDYDLGEFVLGDRSAIGLWQAMLAVAKEQS
jgi:hypothetical protein